MSPRKKGSTWTKTWTSDMDLYGAAFSSSESRLQDMSLFGVSVADNTGFF